MSDFAPEILARLGREFGSRLRVDAAELTACGHDESGLVRRPAAVVAARDEADAARLVRLANEFAAAGRRFCVIPRGSGTGLAGGCLPLPGQTDAVILDLSALNRIKAIDTASLVAVVEPGVVTGSLRRAAREKGLFYPPDPASLDESSIGGNAATNAGGPACVKYGTTRDYVLGVRAVLPTGAVIRAGVNTRKGVVGYDMAHLILGSEGTLGVITELTLKLLPHPKASCCMAGVFPDLGAAMRAIIGVMTGGRLPSAAEFLDARSLALVGDMLPFRVEPGSALVLVECDGDPDQVRREAGEIAAAFRADGAANIMPPAVTDAEREAIWSVRRSVSTRIHDASAVYIPEDIVVPIGRIADMVAKLPAVAERHGVAIYSFGHAGDGNIHLNLTASDAALRPAVEAAAEECVRLALGFGGTLSGEHGIGQAKRKLLPLELAPENVRLQRNIKKLMDPYDVLNPGKIFPEEAA